MRAAGETPERWQNQQLCWPWALTLSPLGLQELQFVWRGSQSLAKRQEIFTHVMDRFSYCT